MYIKSVSLRGFKSFADKIKLNFEPGLIAIVGPNGSGKSNIVDAILWVLGEQSAKLLRGESMEDVIFAGSSIHTPFGMTDACIVLDNSDRVLSVEFSEVSISRQLFRSGESHYLLNGKQSKLNDIKELLSDAALGKGLYSIVSQGKIEEIISSKPDERRYVVDEAAGILKHRLRRAKTEKRLKDIEDKVLRANDIYNEIKRQVRPLERQAEGAKRYIETTDRLKQLETEYLVRKIVKQKNEWDKYVEDESNLCNSQNAIQSKIDSLIEQNIKLKAQAAVIVEDSKKFIRLREESLVANEKINSLTQRTGEALSNIKENISSTDKELKELAQADQGFAKDLLGIQESNLKEIEKLKSYISEANSAHQKLTDNFNSFVSQCDDIDTAIKKIDNEYIEVADEKNLLEFEVTSMEAKIEALLGVYGKKIKDVPKSKWLSPLIDHIKSLPKEYESHVLNIFEKEIEGLLLEDKRHIMDAINTSKHTLTMLPLAERVSKIREKNIVSLAELANNDFPLLKNIYVTKDIGTAIDCQEKYQGKNIYFIFEDKIFTPHGSVRFVSSEDSSIFNLKKGIEELDLVVTSNKKKIKKIAAVLNRLNKRKMELNAKLEKVVVELEECKKQKYESKASIEPAGLQLKNLRKVQTQLDERIIFNVENLRSLAIKKKSRIEGLQELKVALLSKLKNLESLLVVTSRLSEISSDFNNSIVSKRDEINQELENIELEQGQLNSELEKLNIGLSGLDSRINQIQIKKAEVRIKLSELKTQLEDEMGSDIDSAVLAINAEFGTSEIAEEIRNIKSMLTKMGPINMIALDELATLKERENLYRSQLDDLIESKKSLLQVIKELNDSMESSFINFFERFANNFQLLIEEFFSGGRGKLSLSSPDDILSSGIEIEIQSAAGKKFQNLSLFSGGEKAMAALCFLFSLFMSRPTPFCIMDEVDAALDDFNITRLVRFLGNMKKNSQIILITHQKRTMEIADIIFGVSMEPDGTSKIISQKLEVTA